VEGGFMSNVHETYIERGSGVGVLEEWNEEKVFVYYTYNRGCRGARDSLCGVRGGGPALEPDETAGVEIDWVTSAGSGADVVLSDDELKRIHDEIMDVIADREMDCEES
jgi:hypothetical protein